MSDEKIFCRINRLLFDGWQLQSYLERGKGTVRVVAEFTNADKSFDASGPDMPTACANAFANGVRDGLLQGDWWTLPG